MRSSTRARLEADRRRKKKWAALIGTVACLVGVIVVAVIVVVGGHPGDASAGQGSIDTTGSSVGKPFPDFGLTDIDGKTVNRAAFTGKKTIVWFTDSSCEPCQLGAVRVRQLENQLGGQAFAVLAVFVNPQESSSALSAWRTSYGRSDWRVALDTNGALAQKVQLQTLDTKFLLGPDGNILNVDPNPVDDTYVQMLQQKVKP